MRRLGGYISRGVYSVSGPFLPFGGAVDIVVVRQRDGSFKSSPWYVRFGKLHKVLNAEEKEKVKVHVSVNGVEPDFHMYLNLKGEAVFLNRQTQEEEEEQEGEPVIGSGIETNDIQQWESKRNLKSISYKFNSPDKLNSEANVVRRTRSRHWRILGLVSRSLRGGDVDANGVDLVERAEITANLLELKWSTNLTVDHLPSKDRKKTRGGALDNGLPPRRAKEEACSLGERGGVGSKPVLNEMLCPASAGCGEARVHSEVLDAANLLLPEVNDAKFFLVNLLELLHVNINKSQFQINLTLR